MLDTKTIKRLWSKVAITDKQSCWEWQAHRNNLGYGMFGIGQKVWLAHRVAWLAVGGELPPGAVLLHSCDNPACCNPHHLSVGTQTDNMRDCIAKGRGWPVKRYQRGESNCRSKLTESDVSEIRRICAEGKTSHSELAERFGVSRSLIGFIVSGKVWTHLTNETASVKYKQPPLRGSKHGMSKLTETQVREIRKAFASGIRQKDLANQYGVTQENIYRIVRGKSWKWLDGGDQAPTASTVDQRPPQAKEQPLLPAQKAEETNARTSG